MEDSLLMYVEWLPVLVSFVISFALGWLWYSPVMFLKRWQAGLGEPAWQAPMWMPMSAQIGSTLLLAVAMNIIIGLGYWCLAVLVGITMAGFIKANGFYAGKSMWAVSVEVGYIVAMVLVMLAVNYIL